MPNHVLKLYAKATTPRSWRVVTMPNGRDPNPVETALIEHLECPRADAIDRAYDVAREQGFTISGHVVDISATV